MKKVIDNNGVEIEVPASTVVKTVNGTHYLLTPQEIAEEQIKEAEWIADLSTRQTQNILNKRTAEYPIPRAEADVLWHFIKWLKVNKNADYLTLPTEVSTWFNQCEQVKINNPK